MEKKKIIKRKLYSVIVLYYSDGTAKMLRRNRGFSCVELLGILSLVKNNVLGLFNQAWKETEEVDVKSSDSPLLHLED